MTWFEKEISIIAPNRGFHIITSTIIEKLPEISNYSIGILNLYIKHTSASLSINESADPTVLSDMESHFNTAVPENAPYYKHTLEGPDDMPAHIKSTIIGNHISVPIKNGKLDLGTWQGVYLCEHRNVPRKRTITTILNGQLL